jgi:hypothetical protein
MIMDIELRPVKEQPKVNCRLCSTPTSMAGTSLCDACWGLKMRIEQNPKIADRILRDLEPLLEGMVDYPRAFDELLPQNPDAKDGVNDPNFCFDCRLPKIDVMRRLNELQAKLYDTEMDLKRANETIRHLRHQLLDAAGEITTS